MSGLSTLLDAIPGGLLGAGLSLLVQWGLHLFRSPKIRLSIGSDAPFVVTGPAGYLSKTGEEELGHGGKATDATWLRVGVHNTGYRATQARCYLVYLRNLADDRAVLCDEAIDLWPSQGGDGHGSQIVVPRGVTRHFDIMSLRRRMDQTTVPRMPSNFFQVRHPAELSHGTYTIGIMVAGDGFDPVEGWFRVKTGMDCPFNVESVTKQAALAMTA